MHNHLQGEVHLNLRVEDLLPLGMSIVVTHHLCKLELHLHIVADNILENVEEFQEDAIFVMNKDILL